MPSTASGPRRTYEPAFQVDIRVDLSRAENKSAVPTRYFRSLLAPADKELLQVASAVGKDVPFALLRAIAELPEDVLRRGLEHLHGAEFLYESGLYPDLEYSLKHALTHDVTYGGLLQGRRRFTGALSPPLRGSTRIPWAERSSGPPIMPTGASWAGRR